MKITKENYELFLIDYLDGNLSEKDQLELMPFLAQNPAIAEEFNLIKNSKAIDQLGLEADEKLDFSFLKKEDNCLISDDEMIAFIEGDLSEKAKIDFERKLIVYPQNKTNYALYLKTKLPKVELVFENKERLKKKSAIFLSLNNRFLAIAAVLLAFGFFTILYFGQSQVGKENLAFKQGSNKRSEPNAVYPKTETSEIGKPLDSDRMILPAQKSTEMASKNKFALVNKKAKSGTIQTNNLKSDLGEPAVTRIDNEPKISNSQLANLNNLDNQMAEIKIEEQSPILTNKSIGSDRTLAANTPFLNPAEWVKEKVKSRIPQTVGVIDTLKHGGVRLAGSYALQMFERTTGITYQDKKDPSHERSGFSIISKYFAFERSYKTENY